MKKRTVCVFLVMLICVSAFAIPSYAATDEETISPYVYYCSTTIKASECKSLYEIFVDFNGGYSDVSNAISDTLAASGHYTESAIATIISALGSIYLGSVQEELYKGWQSGKGCTVIVFTDVHPYIYAN